MIQKQLKGNFVGMVGGSIAGTETDAALCARIGGHLRINESTFQLHNDHFTCVAWSEYD